MSQHPTVHVHLQEGFEAERVIVSIDDTVVLDDPKVRTKPQIGLARTIEADTTAEVVSVHVDMAERKTKGTVRIQPQATPFVGVSILDTGQVQFRTQAEPFGYL